MATSSPAGVPVGPGQIHGDVSVVAGEVLSDQPHQGQQSAGLSVSGNPSGEQSGVPAPSGQGHVVHLVGAGGLSGGPQVSVAGHVQHVSVAGQVQQAGPGGGEVIVSGGNGGILPGGDGDDLPQKRKATSFKITNVFLSRPPSNDGDDSCDDNEDLEDSHTEDLSDIADLSSLSSQLECVAALHNPVNGLGLLSGQAQVIQPAPGSKHSKAAGQVQQSSKEEYRRPSLAADKCWENSLPPFTHPGFGFVTYQHTGGATYPVSYVDKATGYLPVAGTMAVINNVEKGGVSEVPVSSQAVVGPQDFRTRFKIVKVETTEPLKRGRWTCFDFVDKPAAKEPKEKESQPEVTKPVTVVTTKPVTKNNGVGGAGGNSRPGSTLPKEEGNEQGSTLRAESVEASMQELGRGEAGEKSGRESRERLPGQTETAPVASIVSGSVSEERELDTGKSMGHSSRLTNSVPPDGLRNAGYPSGTFPNQPPVSVASSNGQTSAVPAQPPNLNITLPQPVGMASGATAQSPHTGVRPDFPQVQTIQGSLGQVVRLPDGQLAQVALAPLGQVGQQQSSSQQSSQQQQQQVVLKRIPNSTNQQVVVNAQGQHFIVQQQQQNISQVPPQQQPNRSPAGPQSQQQQPPPNSQQQQPAKKVSQQPQQPVSAAGVAQSQQNPFSLSGQVAAPTSLPSAQAMQQPPGPTVPLQQGPAGAPSQNAQSQVSSQATQPAAAPVSQPQQPVNPPILTQATVPLPNLTPGQVPASAGPGPQVSTIKRTGLPPTSNPAVPQPASSVPTGHPNQLPQPVRNSSSAQPQPAVSGLSVAQPSLSVAQPAQNLNTVQPGSSLAQPGQSLGQIGTSAAHIGPSGAQLVQQSQNGAQPAQSLPQNGQNSSNTVASVSGQGLGAPSLPQSSVGGNVALGSMVYASMPSTTLSSLPGQTSSAATLSTHTTFYPIPYGHPVYSGVTGAGVGQVDNSFGLVSTAVGLDGEGLVERLEDLVSTQFSEEGKDGELEHESASGAGQGSIDNRIEQAMDLVKSHLMSAVRSEVEELRDKISKLEDTVTILSRENEVLRANVNPEVLASLTGNRNLVGGMNSISNLPCQPPDPAIHPALQPPNQH